MERSLKTYLTMYIFLLQEVEEGYHRAYLRTIGVFMSRKEAMKASNLKLINTTCDFRKNWRPYLGWQRILPVKPGLVDVNRVMGEKTYSEEEICESHKRSGIIMKTRGYKGQELIDYVKSTSNYDILLAIECFRQVEFSSNTVVESKELKTFLTELVEKNTTHKDYIECLYIIHQYD